MSLDEDRLNKPHRPIPSGLLGLEQAYKRCFISWTASPFIIYLTSGPTTCLYFLCWEMWVFVCYVWPAWNNWILRNLFTALGLVLQLRIANALLTYRAPHLEVSILGDFQIGLWGLFSIHIQEFKDVAGDRVSKANTLPLIIHPSSLQLLRQSIAFTVISMHIVQMVQTWSMCSFTFCRGAYVTLILNMILAVLVALRMIGSQDQENDRLTYFWVYVPLGIAAILHNSILFT